MSLEPFLSLILSLTGRKKFCGFLAKANKKDMVFLKDLLDAGKIIPAIDRRYPLSDTAEAIRYLEQGHAQGKVILTVQPGTAGSL
jgi:NADPH:quinone reductase-like Zn-dependent oxidoreductase